jgi:hypothetical protein
MPLRARQVVACKVFAEQSRSDQGEEPRLEWASRFSQASCENAPRIGSIKSARQYNAHTLQ